MNQYEITHMIIDDDFYGQESVTAEFSYENKNYSITFQKGDFEILNKWTFVGDSSVPANLPDHLIEKIREDIKKRI